LLSARQRLQIRHVDRRMATPATRADEAT
jgi:hypothetical protein